MTAPRLRAIVPIFSTSDVARWTAHYLTLGFTVEAYDESYAFAWTDEVEIHAGLDPDHDPARTAASAFLAVDDADAVHAAWSTAGHRGRDIAPRATPHGIHEGAHVDPDGNLLRYGRPPQ